MPTPLEPTAAMPKETFHFLKDLDVPSQLYLTGDKMLVPYYGEEDYVDDDGVSLVAFHCYTLSSTDGQAKRAIKSLPVLPQYSFYWNQKDNGEVPQFDSINESQGGRTYLYPPHHYRRLSYMDELQKALPVEPGEVFRHANGKPVTPSQRDAVIADVNSMIKESYRDFTKLNMDEPYTTTIDIAVGEVLRSIIAEMLHHAGAKGVEIDFYQGISPVGITARKRHSFSAIATDTLFMDARLNLSIPGYGEDTRMDYLVRWGNRDGTDCCVTADTVGSIQDIVMALMPFATMLASEYV